MKTIKVKNLDISYIEEGSGQAIVFLHGWGTNKETFIDTYNYFKNRYHVYSFDFPGFGESSEPSNALTIYDYCDILEEFLDVLNIKNPIFIAHSFGCRVSLLYNAKHQSDQKYIITGGAGIKPKRSLKFRLSVINYKIMKFLVKTPLYSHYKDDLFSNSGSEDYKNASPIMRQILSNVVNEDLTFTLKEIDNDTLLYWGKNDDATPVSDAYIMQDLISKNTLLIKENSTHYAFLENISNFNEEIDIFLKK